MTPEAKVKDKIKKILKSSSAYFAMPATGGYGSSGVPDFLVCIRGKFIGVEAKANGGKPTALQLKNLSDIQSAGGIAIIVNEDNLNEFERIINEHA